MTLAVVGTDRADGDNVRFTQDVEEPFEGEIAGSHNKQMILVFN